MATDLATDIRARVINGLARGIGSVIAAIDELEAAAKAEDRARTRAAGRRLFAARNDYLDPIVRRAEEGVEW